MKVEDVPDALQHAVVAAYIALGTAPGGPDEVDIPSHNEVAFILAAVIPAIQAEALERAAVVADDKAAAYDRRWEAERKYSGRDASATADQRATALQLAAAIRALKEGA